eukprot:12634287-Prorocentrum_lima.AAC.1
MLLADAKALAALAALPPPEPYEPTQVDTAQVDRVLDMELDEDEEKSLETALDDMLQAATKGGDAEEVRRRLRQRVRDHSKGL